MMKLADSLRLLDEDRFRAQIARIEETLRIDATWNLEAALASCARSRTLTLPAPSERQQ